VHCAPSTQKGTKRTQVRKSGSRNAKFKCVCPSSYTEMYAGYACCPLVSHVKYTPRTLLRLSKDRTDRRTEGRTPDRYTTLTARRDRRDKTPAETMLNLMKTFCLCNFDLGIVAATYCNQRVCMSVCLSAIFITSFCDKLKNLHYCSVPDIFESSVAC